MIAASERITQVQRELEVLRAGARISAGFAELRHDDTLRSLVARADTDFYRARNGLDEIRDG
jgi:hypothetical protein